MQEVLKIGKGMCCFIVNTLCKRKGIYEEKISASSGARGGKIF